MRTVQVQCQVHSLCWAIQLLPHYLKMWLRYNNIRFHHVSFLVFKETICFVVLWQGQSWIPKYQSSIDGNYIHIVSLSWSIMVVMVCLLSNWGLDGGHISVWFLYIENKLTQDMLAWYRGWWCEEAEKLYWKRINVTSSNLRVVSFERCVLLSGIPWCRSGFEDIVSFALHMVLRDSGTDSRFLSTHLIRQSSMAWIWLLVYLVLLLTINVCEIMKIPLKMQALAVKLTQK